MLQRVAVAAALILAVGCSADKSTGRPGAAPDSAWVPAGIGAPQRVADGGLTLVTAAIRYVQPVAQDVPAPVQANSVWGAAQVRTCLGPREPDTGQLFAGSWRLIYPDASRAEASSVTYDPASASIFGGSRCRDGTIIFPVPARVRPVRLEFTSSDGRAKAAWAIR